MSITRSLCRECGQQMASIEARRVVLMVCDRGEGNAARRTANQSRE